MFQNIFSKLSSAFSNGSNGRAVTPEYHLVEVIRITPHRFKVSSLKLSNPVVLIHGRRSNFFLVMKEGNTQSLFVRGNNLYGELGTGERRKPAVDLEEVFTISNAEIKFVKSGGRHSMIVVRREDRDELYACGYNNYSQCGIKVSHEPGWIDNYDSDTTTRSNEYISSWTKAEWPPKRYMQEKKCKKNHAQNKESQVVDDMQIVETTEELENSIRQSTGDSLLEEEIIVESEKKTAKDASTISSFMNTFFASSSQQSSQQSNNSNVRVLSTGSDSTSNTGNERKDQCSSDRASDENSTDSTLDDEDWRIKFIDCGACHTVIVTETNRIFVRGYNEMGMCGIGTTEHAFRWQELISPHLQGEEIRHVATQCFSTIFLTATNNIYVCGYNMQGRGSERVDCFLVPTRVTYPFPGPITHLEAGEDHVLVVTEDRNLYACGSNRHYECGFSNNHNRHEFEKVQSDVLDSIDTIKKVACGVNNSIIFSSDRKLRAFGEFFSILDDDEYLLLDAGYLHDVTMLDDRFIFIRSNVPDIFNYRDDWNIVQTMLKPNKMEQGVEALIPTPIDFQRRSNFEEQKRSPKKRKFETVRNETAQVHLKRPRFEEPLLSNE